MVAMERIYNAAVIILYVWYKNGPMSCFGRSMSQEEVTVGKEHDDYLVHLSEIVDVN